MNKKTRNILIGIGAAALAGISMYGTRKLNEKICKMENEKTRIKETTEIGHINDLEMEVVKIKNIPGILIYSDESIFLFLDRIDNHKETMIGIELFLEERGIKKNAFKGIIAASYSKAVNDIYMEENPELVNMDETSVLYNKPVFLTSDANSVDFGIPIKVGRSVMISAGMASTGPVAYPVAIGKKLIKQGLILNLRDKGMVLITADTGKNLITTMQQMFAFGNVFISVLILHDEGGELGVTRKIIRKAIDIVYSGAQKINQKIGRPMIDESMKEQTEVLTDMISHGVVLCGNHSITSTMEFKELFDENIKIIRFNEKFSI